jgi:hypothetical protein
VSAERVGLLPPCAECGSTWEQAEEERWSAYHTDDEPAEVVFYCAACAIREFKN